MASAMASLTLPSSLTSGFSLSTQLQQQSQAQSVLVVRSSAPTEDSSLSSGSRDPTLPSTTRRQAALSLAGLSLVLLAGSSSRAEAKDIPLFGIRKKVEEVKEAVVEEVKELVKEGEAEVKELVKQGEAEVTAVEAAVTGAFGGGAPASVASPPSESGISPALQAAVVAGAELLAVVAASSVVSGLVSQK